MLGQTNTFKQSDSSGGGDVIFAVNRTGVSIGKGGKVWVIPQAQQAGDGFTIYKGSDSNTEFITDNNCDYIRYSSGLYYLGNGSSELIAGGFSSFVSDAIYNYGGKYVNNTGSIEHAVEMLNAYCKKNKIDFHIKKGTIS